MLGPTGLPVIAARDVAIGRPDGAAPARRPQPGPAAEPVAVLRAALRRGLEQGPCVVAFSGGRDSSVLLATAADVAAREGLPAPVALTFRYPGDPAADESCWQELVIGHLRSTGRPVAWERRDIADELDVIGPLAAPVLRGHGGPTFPAPVGNTILLARSAAGGSLVTGNGGDEVLGGHRCAVLRAAVRRRGRGLTAGDWRLVAESAAPGPLRAWCSGSPAVEAPWLRPSAAADARRRARRSEARRPLRWDRSVRSALASQAAEVGALTREQLARAEGAALVEPFADPGFIDAYAAFGGRWAGVGRTDGTRLLAAGLLPEAVVRRRDKAYFNASRFGPCSQAFAANWDGHGVDTDLVDPAVLRRSWLADVAPAGSAMLLQQAWLAGQR